MLRVPSNPRSRPGSSSATGPMVCGWVVGGWFCPVVNFWFPKQIVDDVIAASDPRTPPLFPDLRRIPRHGLVLAWWLTWVVIEVRGNLGPSVGP
jgi:hypothetical protein